MNVQKDNDKTKSSKLWTVFIDMLCSLWKGYSELPNDKIGCGDFYLRSLLLTKIRTLINSQINILCGMSLLIHTIISIAM